MEQAPLAQPHLSRRDRFRHYYHQHELKVEVLFFCLGFAFDFVAVGEGADHLLMIIQQMIYLSVVGAILYMDILREARGGEAQFSPKMERLWDYRGLALHFCLGTLMNLYSIFFLLSASLFSSMLFVILLFGALIVNELKVVRKRGADVKVALYVICVFCFASLMFPLVFHRVGLIPFLCAFATTLLLVGFYYRLLRGKIGPSGLRNKVLIPGLGVSALFLALYLVGLIPPVPVSIKKMGIYHNIVKPKDADDDDYVLYHERSAWKFWQRGDQDFVARPGDKIWLFAAIYSPSRFAEKFNVVFASHGPKGWTREPPIAFVVNGGRKEGYRLPVHKDHYDSGDGRWRVAVETDDGREIGRIYFDVEKADADPSRVLTEERY